MTKKFTKKETCMLNFTLALYNDSIRTTDAHLDAKLVGALALLCAYFGKDSIGKLRRQSDSYLCILDTKGNVFYGCYPCALHF